MAITSAQQSTLFKVFTGMFGAAPGGYYEELVSLTTANGPKGMASILANSNLFKSLYPTSVGVPSEFADAFLTNLLGASFKTANAANFESDKAWLASQIIAQGVGNAVFDYLVILDGTTNATYASAKTAWTDKVTNATTYTLTNAGSSKDITTLTNATTSAGTAVGQTFTLTEGVDTLVGTDKGDVFNATHKTGTLVLGGLDTIDGGAGKDTLNIADTLTTSATAGGFVLPAGMKITNVETLNVTTNGSLGDDASAATAFDISGITGLTSFIGTSAGDSSTTNDTSIKAAGTTDVTLTVAAAQDVTVNGGKTVSITGGNKATVTDAAGATGTTLTAVTLNNVGSVGSQTSVLTGNGIASVTLSGSQVDGGAANTITVTNATVDHALTINAAGTGYDSAATPVQVSTVVTDTAATSLTINTSAKSAINASGSTLVKTVTLTGAGELDLTAMGAATTTINGSAATGALLLNTLNAATVNVSTGSGNDKFTATTTNKLTIDTGAGNDIVTLSGALVAGSTIKLGAGNDTLLGGTAVLASTATAITSIDGGDGIDSVASTLINAGNAAKFVNFETISIGNATVDAALLTASTITGLSIDGATGTGVLQNVTQAQSLTVNADNIGTSTLTFTGVTGTADAYAITFNATTTGTTASPTAIAAGTVIVNGIENVTIHSNAAAGVAQNSITLTDSTLQTLSIDGSQDLTVAFAGTNGTVVSSVGGVSSIDGSAATGKLDIDVANVTAATVGLSVKGGSAVDTLTTKAEQSATLTGNGGNDIFEVAATASNVTAGAGATEAAMVAGTYYNTTITDFTKGDTIVFKAATGTTTFNPTKVDVSTATNLATALDLAAATNVGANNANFTWFNYGGNTYIVQDLNTNTTLAATDVVVKLNGVYDFSTGATVSAAEVFSWA